MDKNDLYYLKKNIKDAYLVCFGNSSQFIYLEFNNSQFEKIKLYLDCEISINNTIIEEIGLSLKFYSEDMYTLAYFIALNRKMVKKCYSNETSLNLVFENLIEIKFNLEKPEFNIGVTFKEKYDDFPGINFEIDLESLKPIIT